MSNEESSTNPPQVLIAGAGVAGLFLGILLERAKIPYTIFERAATVKPLGALMSLNVNILGVLEQLGLYDDLVKVSYANRSMSFYTESMKEIRTIDNRAIIKQNGYELYVFPRPEFYKLLLAQLPAEKLKFNKKIIAIDHPAAGSVAIECADGTSYIGDILVGADGAYSGVRKSLYKHLNEKGLLPHVDTQKFDIGYMTMVGTTDPLDEEKIPDLKDDFSHFRFVFGRGKPYTWHTFTAPDKRICWGVQVQLKTSASIEDKSNRTGEWGPEGNEAMIKEVYDFPTPYGLLGQFIDATPRDRISKVFLEEKLFETWYHGRTVLIGDAAHKMNPAQGQGAVNALQDAVILANCLYDIAHKATPENITAAFQDYKGQRYPHVEFQVNSSKFQGKLFFGQSLFERFLRQAILGYLPEWFTIKDAIRASEYRPQCTYLPLAAKRGTATVLPQQPSKRYTEELERKQRESDNVATV